MGDHATRADSPPRTSPWPILIAVGLVGAEVGIILDLFPVAVGGLVLLARSLVGILSESGYLSRPRVLAAGLGVAFVAVGLALYGLGTGLLAGGTGAETLVGLESRGLAIAVAGALTLAGAAVLPRVRRA
ncbi:DUF7541 family protein [Natrononativus amylolyticus]|uniref:DUF7541 family protein n=1 Tax=Natrononativus amylolyticus TaxID=2963434 RepID=UPI0020CE9A73|nr:hypothetical protein [Natrononativus amylolyticus]